MDSFISELSTFDTIEAVAFIVGMIWAIPSQSHLLKNPLTCLFDGIFSAIIYSFGANLVASLIPATLRFIVPLTLIASAIYDVWHKSKLESTHPDYCTRCQKAKRSFGQNARCSLHK